MNIQDDKEFIKHYIENVMGELFHMLLDMIKKDHMMGEKKALTYDYDLDQNEAYRFVKLIKLRCKKGNEIKSVVKILYNHFEIDSCENSIKDSLLNKYYN